MASVDPVTNYRLIGPSEVGRVEDLVAGKPEKKSRLRLQALIAEWLRMENLVVLTGAGCSVSLGGKTMDALEGASLAAAKFLPGLPASLSTFIDQRLAATADKLDAAKKLSFEDWLSYLANAAFIAADKRSDLLPNLPPLISRVCSGYAPDRGVLRTQSV